MIARQQPVRRFWPMTGKARLLEHALTAALLEPAARVLLLGGEERGTWLLEQGTASDRSFAFAILLTGDPTGAIGKIDLVAASVSKPTSAPAGSPLLPAFADAVADRQPLQWSGAAGDFALSWS
jgi:hypothetical protein